MHVRFGRTAVRTAVRAARRRLPAGCAALRARGGPGRECHNARARAPAEAPQIIRLVPLIHRWHQLAD
jgi:hypothetical protein